VVRVSIDKVEESSLLATIERMAELAPGEDGSGVFERGSASDATGHSELAAPLYGAALSLGMTGERRRRATIQMASGRHCP